MQEFVNMFDEDPQWNEGRPDSFEDGLHHKLFGNVGREVSGEDESAPADTSLTRREAGDRKSKKRKRAREREVIREAVKGMEEGMTERKKEGAAAEEKDNAETNSQKSGKGTTSKKRTHQVTATQETQPRKRRKKGKTESDGGGYHSTDGSGTARKKAANGTSAFNTSANANTPTLTEPREASATSSTPRKKSDLSSKLFSKMSSRLEGSRFRMINQQLYTSTGAEAKTMFDSDPELFDVYHRGFSTQVSKWPTNPLDRVIAHIRTLPQSSVIADFGCGEAQLAQTVPHTVHSFDLVAVNVRVTACDMAHVPLAKHTVDVCIFCLSLMGSNMSDFIREARRVLKRGGEMRICEVLSRFSSVDEFVKDVEAFGFELLTKTEFSKMFLELVFRTVKWDTKTDVPQIILKPCIYKRR